MAFDQLIFEDHFDKGMIDPAVWTHEIGFIRNHEPQYYTDEARNAYVEDSLLKIVTLREEYQGAHYTSASLHTLGNFSFLYGRVEMRAKLPWSKGLWPAFWMMGENWPQVDWPHCGEIDIMEMIGNAVDPSSNGRMSMSLHWHSKERDDVYSSIEYFQMEEGKFADAFHIYAVEWEETELRWYFDDRLTRRTKITEDMKGCFNRPHFILVNTALSDWNDDERPDAENTHLPQEYCIDYIRVYQTKDH